MKEPMRTDLGTVRIHRKVIASIASIAASNVEGVVRIGGDLKSNLIELLGKRELASIKVDIDKHNEVKIEVPVIVKYGYNIPEVANKIQQSIREAIDKMTDLNLKDIDIQIRGIESNKGGRI